MTAAHRPSPLLGLLATILVVAGGCATFQPEPLDAVPFLERAETETEGELAVTVAVLTNDESRAVFGVDLAKKGVQPVFIRVENTGDSDRWLLPVALDPDYFSPFEAARRGHFALAKDANRQMDEHFYALHKEEKCPPGVSEGFIFTNLDQGVKYLNLLFVGRDRRVFSFEFVHRIPGFQLDAARVNRETLYTEDEYFEVDLDDLRAALESLPPCVFGPDLETPADPLNIVIVADPTDALAAFSSRGWHVTEAMHGGSIARTVASSVFGSKYDHSPVSPLYLYDRPQDIALQKARETVDERNHLRLWLTPIRFEGKDVFVGQISRDIDVRLSSKTLVTHKIDPEIDDARNYLFQDFLLARRLDRFGLVAGVGAATIDAPRKNYTLDPYFTDGLRGVFFISDDLVPLREVERLWE